MLDQATGDVKIALFMILMFTCTMQNMHINLSPKMSSKFQLKIKFF
jgi:hypothetical protein